MTGPCYTPLILSPKDDPRRLAQMKYTTMKEERNDRSTMLHRPIVPDYTSIDLSFPRVPKRGGVGLIERSSDRLANSCSSRLLHEAHPSVQLRMVDTPWSCRWGYIRHNLPRLMPPPLRRYECLERHDCEACQRVSWAL